MKKIVIATPIYMIFFYIAFGIYTVVACKVHAVIDMYCFIFAIPLDSLHILWLN